MLTNNNLCIQFSCTWLVIIKHVFDIHLKMTVESSHHPNIWLTSLWLCWIINNSCKHIHVENITTHMEQQCITTTNFNMNKHCKHAKHETFWKKHTHKNKRCNSDACMCFHGKFMCKQWEIFHMGFYHKTAVVKYAAALYVKAEKKINCWGKSPFMLIMFTQ